jgi:Domain of unknown function (DUF4386)
MRNREARIAGFLYLLAVIVGWFSLMYVPDRLFVRGDAAATAHNIVANELLFRLGMAGDLAGGLVWLFVVLALYQLLKDVDRTQAGLMLVLGAFMQVPLYFVNVLNYVAALLLVTNTPFLSVFSVAQREAMAMLFLRLHYYELVASFVFAGLWLVPFGILVFKSQFLPRTLGVWLIVNGFAYLAICFTTFLAPQYAGTVSKITFPLTFGEIAIMLWLLIIGPRTIGGHLKSQSAAPIT